MNLIAMLMLAADPGSQPQPDVLLLDFTAGYCQPCQQMAPILQRMERDRFPIRKIDITEQPDVSRQYKVDRIPTLILLVEGQEAKRFVGLTAEDELRRVMNDAARKLDMRRKAEAPAEESTFDTFVEQQEQPDVPTTSVTESMSPGAPRSGLRGVLDRMRNSLTGRSRDSELEDSTPPDFRAQSPDENSAVVNASLPMQSTVRVHLDDGEFKDVGTGTIVHSATGQSTILTCAHIFKEVSGKARVVVEVFRDGEVLKYPAQVLGGDHDSDVAFLRIQNTSPLPTVPLSSGKLSLKADEPVFSIGCNGGALPTQLNMNVVKVNFFEGPENIVCNVDPVQGRSGGGLFNASGELIGVCSGAFRESKEGLYTGVGAVRKLIGELKLTSLFGEEPAAFESGLSDNGAFAEASSPFADNDDDLFAQMFEDEAPVFDQAPAAAATQPVRQAAPQALPDPFQRPARTVATPTAGNQTVPATEITVIIDSGDPTKGKQVVVIPRASPWLLQLLTGEPPASAEAVADLRSNVLSTTSARQQATRKPIATSPVTRSNLNRSNRSQRTAVGHLLPTVN